MIIEVKVIPNSKKVSISEEGNKLKVHVKSQAIENMANKELIEVLSDYFKIKRNKIKIIKGEKSRKKLVEIA